MITYLWIVCPVLIYQLHPHFRGYKKSADDSGSFTTNKRSFLYKTMKFTVILLALVGFTAAAEPAVKPVKISLYYESLCPDSRAFVLTQLAPTYEKLAAHLTLDLVPFGNVNVTHASNSSTPRFACQHGPAECYGNIAEACVIAHQPPAAALSFVQCMFLGVHRSVDSWKDTHFNAEACANLLFSNWGSTDLKKCIDGPEGEKLIEANWKKTEALKPKHTGVPWILVNEAVHTPEMQRQAQFSLKDYLCKEHFSKANLLECMA